jgi:HEAT repeat protein
VIRTEAYDSSIGSPQQLRPFVVFFPPRETIMKRFILPLLFIGIAVTVLGVVGFVAVKYVSEWTPPISYEEMEELQDKPEQAAAAIPRIVACFERNDETLRAQAAETLSKIGPKSVDPVREKLKSKNAKVRYWAVLTLALIGLDAGGASGDVLACLNDDDPDVRYKAVYALGKLGVKSDAVLDGLVKALGDMDNTVSTTAIDVLGKIGPPSKESVPMLARLADKDSPPAVRTLAIKLLGQIGKAAAPAFKELLKNADTLDKIALIQAIATLGPDATPLLGELQTIMIKNRFWDAQEELIGTFKKCGPDGASGLANVLKALHDPKSPHFAPDDDRSKTLLQGIGAMGAAGKPAVPVLIDVLKDRDTLRLQILETLGDIGPAAKEAISVVEPLTKDADTAAAARVALRRMGVLDKQ